MQRKSSSLVLCAYALLVVVLLAVPFIGLYPVLVMKVICFAIFACAFNLLFGYTGLLSFGHAAFFGSAAYATGWIVRALNVSPEVGVLFGVGIAAVIGLVVGAIAIRRQGIYFAMITLALAQMVYFACLQMPFTHGEDGLQGVPRGRLFGVISLESDLAMYYFVLAVVGAGLRVHPPHRVLAVRPGAEGDPRERAASDLARVRGRSLQAAGVRPLVGAGRPRRIAEDAGARLRDAVRRALVDVRAK